MSDDVIVCGYCEELPCECNICSECEFPANICECAAYGNSKKPPWETRGIVVNPPNKKSVWEITWPEIDTGIDPIQSAADFYLLESISAGVLAPIPGLNLTALRENKEADEAFFELYGIKTKATRKAMQDQRDKRILERLQKDPIYRLQWLMGEADRLLDDLVDLLDVTLVAYSHMAISGELRHHHAYSTRLGHTDRPTAWCGWRMVYKAVGNEALMDAAHLFYEFGAGGGYGGPPWANCAETLYARLEGKLGPDGPDGRINKRMFIDRFWTLEHNGGCFLNKLHWSMLNRPGWGLGMLKSLLDAHGAQPTDAETLLSCASPDVLTVYEKYLETVNKVEVTRGLEPTPNVAENMFREYKICSGCSSDVTKGHYGSCPIMTDHIGWGFGNGNCENQHGTWYNTHFGYQLKCDENEGESPLLNKWKKSQTDDLPYGADGKLKLKPTTKLDVVLDLKLDSTDGDYGKVTKAKEKVTATYQDILDGKVEFIPKVHQEGDKPVKFYSYTVKVSMAGTGTTIVQAGGIGNEFSEVKPAEWMTKPIPYLAAIKEKIA